MNIDKVAKYHKAVHETLGHSKERINKMVHSKWFDDDVDIKTEKNDVKKK